MQKERELFASPDCVLKRAGAPRAGGGWHAAVSDRAVADQRFAVRHGFRTQYAFSTAVTRNRLDTVCAAYSGTGTGGGPSGMYAR